jgi:hypothetical protein
MDDLIPKVERVARELDEIRDQLHQPGSSGRTPLDLELLAQFKSSVDHMRHVLWAYIEAMSQPVGDKDETLHQYRMKRATEMLRLLREHGPLGTGSPQESSFLREVQAIADGALKRYAKSSD